MFGIDPLTASTLMILAASGNSSVCTMPKPAEITVIPRAEETKYDYSQSMADLQAYSMDTIDPYGFHGVSATQGFMKGRIKLIPEVELDYKPLPRYGAVCLWYDSITISIELDPTIVIASEVYDDACMRKAVLEHEEKHVRIERVIANKYSKIMGRKVYDALAQRGFLVGPVRQEDAQSIIGRMQKTVFQIVEHEYKKMDLERTEKQRDLDSLDEYQSVSSKCPEYHARRNALRSNSRR